MRTWLTAGVATALWTFPNAAAADGIPSLDVRGFNVSSDPASGLYYEPASSPATFDYNAALWLSYAHAPVTLRDPATDEVANRVIGHQLSGDFVVNMGFAERFALGIDLPFVPFQTGDDPTAKTTELLGDYSLPSQALGDLKVLAKFTIVPPTSGEFGGFAMALHNRFGVPTGDERSFMGEGHITNEARVLLEYRYLALGVHGAVGFKARAEHEAYGCAKLGTSIASAPAVAGADSAGDQLLDQCATSFGHEIPFGLALVLLPQALGIDPNGRWTWFVETYGYVPAGPNAPFTRAAVSQMQVGGGARFEFDSDVSLLAGVDAALLGGIGNAPVRGTLSLQWAPRKHDADDDGVRDELDKCPEEGLKEDIDGFQDEDGCPDWDNDDDGVPDEADQCGTAKEDEDGFQDDDGCPDPDNDGDGIFDKDDSCPDVAGIPSADASQRGCPDRDPDRDGVEGSDDQCPDVKEDRDGFEDADGCPDPDNDGDGFSDDDDACPDLPGGKFEDESQNGCPDQDGDAIADGKDACPDLAGVSDQDAGKHGCPKEPARP